MEGSFHHQLNIIYLISAQHSKQIPDKLLKVMTKQLATSNVTTYMLVDKLTASAPSRDASPRLLVDACGELDTDDRLVLDTWGTFVLSMWSRRGETSPRWLVDACGELDTDDGLVLDTWGTFVLSMWSRRGETSARAMLVF